MLPLDEAVGRILGLAEPLEAVEVTLTEALGLTLAESLAGDVDAPPFDRAERDGLAVRAADVPVGGRLYVQGHAARSHAFQRVLADLSERPVYVPATTDVADTGALGACVQAAAVLHQLDPGELADAWGLQPVRVIEPEFGADADEIRAEYTALRVA